jgi:hypothetical protein
MISHRKSNEKFKKVELIVRTRANSLLAKNKGPYIHGYLYLENDFAMSRGKLKSSKR